MAEVVPIRKDIDPAPRRLFRHEIPADHRSSLDTRLLWLWHQRFGTVQMVYTHSSDLLDRTAATLVLQCIMARDLKSIQQLFQRIEGGSVFDQDMSEQDRAFRV